MIRKHRLFLPILAFLWLSSFAADNSSPTLKSVMQGLGRSMNNLNQGIFLEDFTLIEKAALEVASHPKPKSQLPTIIKTLNVRMPQFKSTDSKVHHSAIDIAKLAKKRDMAGILNKHSVIMENCVACHTQFRLEISRVLSQ